jgi:hypothetical protein
MHHRSSFASLLALTLPLSACTASTNAGGAGAKTMLDDIAVGQNRCPDEDGEARPFVVEWDATDLAAFEAKAARDLVFVKYEQCEIEMLYGCSDNGVPGRYGAYDSPVFTSGTVESFLMRDQAELWAKLPLGAAEIGAQVSSGQTLELQYFVSGTANSTRNYVERAAIADNGRCAKATHFVSAYNLGAFRLLAHEQASKSGKAGVAGGGSESESANLKHGGELDDCTSRTQQRCRVPIRLVLQPIDETAQDLDASAAGAPRPDPEPAEDTVSERAEKLRDAAYAKAQARDAAGCLEDLDRADALEDTDESRPVSVELRAYCTMLTDCEAGGKLLMEAIQLADPKKKANDYQVTAVMNRAQLAYCPFDSFSEGMIGTALLERGRMAMDENQPQRCIEIGEYAAKLLRKTWKAGKSEPFSAGDALLEVSKCLAILGDCEGSKRWYFEYELVWEEKKGAVSKQRRAEVEAEAAEAWSRSYPGFCGQK